MRWSLVFWCAVVGGLAMTGCDSSVDPAGAGVGGAGGGGAASGTSATSGGDSCTVEMGQPAGDLTVTVTNATEEPIYFEDDLCGGPLLIAFESLPTARGGDPGCGLVPLDCTPDRAKTIEPGAEASLSWGGLLVERVPTPNGCYEGGPPGEIFCDRGVAPTAGTMGTATFYFLRSCDDPSDYTSCSDQSQVQAAFVHEPNGSLELTVTGP